MPPFEIDAKAIRKLAELMAETSLSEIEIAEGERRIRVSRGGPATTVVSAMPGHLPVAAGAPAPVVAASPASHPGAVPSPMVGTTYLQSEPGSPPFVAAGSQVRVGDTLLIIEAMKVMNPIKAPKAGTVTQILVADGQPVEYGEPLMIIE